jgi:isopentenyl-diphosphate delta-isomerase
LEIEKNIMQEQRKLDHIELTLKAQKNILELDDRFNYEPLLSAHPSLDKKLETKFFGKNLKAPLWVSSMTGGNAKANLINQNLAKVCREFGLGMGLGSCRTLLESNSHFDDFNLRPIIGDDLPLYANLGIAQIEKSLIDNSCHKIFQMLEKLSVDGLFIHINPLQEYLQIEGDIISRPPLETIKNFLKLSSTKVVIKEVGQGMGPLSLKALVELPITGIELAGFGGTNFSEVELLRRPQLNEQTHSLNALSRVGHSALEMVEILNGFSKNHPKDIIISGGIKNFLDSYYLLKKSTNNSVIGQAKNFLVHAHDYEKLRLFVQGEIAGLHVAHAFLSIKERNI